MELQKELKGFEEAGIGVVAITYDAPALQQRFIDQFGIEYPLIADIDTATFRALGILNREYRPGDPGYGIPYPGIWVVEPNGEIVAKAFIRSYKKRLENAALLRAAKEELGVAEPAPVAAPDEVN